MKKSLKNKRKWRKSKIRKEKKKCMVCVCVWGEGGGGWEEHSPGLETRISKLIRHVP